MNKSSLILIVLFLRLHVKAIALPCNFNESVNITDGTDHGNGSISFNGDMFHKNTYAMTDQIYLDNGTVKTVDRHLRGCFCNLETSKPCVQFCCPENYIKNESNSVCEPFEHNALIIRNFGKSVEKNVTDNYRIISWQICETDIMFDEWELAEVNVYINLPVRIYWTFLKIKLIASVEVFIE